MADQQPGATINPGQDAQETQQQNPEPASPAPSPPEPEEISDLEPSQEDNKSFYREEDTSVAPVSEPAPAVQDAPEPVTWTGSEYIAHQKGPAWYLLLLLAIAGTSGIVYFVTSDSFSTVIVAVIGIAFGVFAARKPQILEYSIDEGGIRIGQKVYSYDEFKSFSAYEDGAIVAITLMPLKRLMPPLTIYSPPEIEDNVLETLGTHLPYEENSNPDNVDKLMRHIRF